MILGQQPTLQGKLFRNVDYYFGAHIPSNDALENVTPIRIVSLIICI